MQREWCVNCQWSWRIGASINVHAKAEDELACQECRARAKHTHEANEHRRMSDSALAGRATSAPHTISALARVICILEGENRDAQACHTPQGTTQKPSHPACTNPQHTEQTTAHACCSSKTLALTSPHTDPPSPVLKHTLPVDITPSTLQRKQTPAQACRPKLWHWIPSPPHNPALMS